LSIALHVRKLASHELTFVRATWKNDLGTPAPGRDWATGLSSTRFWLLVNHVIDKVTLPSCEVFVGCNPDFPETPLCWVAIRRLEGLSTYAVVYLYARRRFMRHPEVAATMQSMLIHEVKQQRALLSGDAPPFDPFQELSR
jgi:hypothetical protein